MSSIVIREQNSEALETTCEVYVKGKWVEVPALQTNWGVVPIRGRSLRVAAVQSEEWLKDEVDPNLFLADLRQPRNKPWRADLFTFSQKLPASTPKYEYPMESESVAAIHLTTFSEWWDNLPQATRKNVRRAEKRGVEVRMRQLDDSLVEELVSLINDSPFIQGARNKQFGKTASEIRKDFSSFLDRSEFICAYVGDELVGFLKVVYRGDGVASILNLIAKPSHDDKRPANAVIAKAVERCVENRVSYFTYGLFNYGNKRDSSLREFKIRNGFSEFLVPRFYVPLTRWGAVCIRLGFHRGLIGILPHSLIAGAVRLRTKWYYLKNCFNKAGVA